MLDPKTISNIIILIFLNIFILILNNFKIKWMLDQRCVSNFG